MVKSYVVETRFNMTFARTYIEKGDILLYDPNNSHKVSVYRNQKLVVTANAPKSSSIPALADSGWIKIVKDLPPAKPVATKPVAPVVPASKAPAPKPATCPTCGLGIDDNGDGDCAVCAYTGPSLTEQIDAAATVNQKLALLDRAVGTLEFAQNTLVSSGQSSVGVANRLAELRQLRETLLTPAVPAQVLVTNSIPVPGLPGNSVIVNAPASYAVGVEKHEDAKAAGLSDAEARAIGFEEDEKGEEEIDLGDSEEKQSIEQGEDEVSLDEAGDEEDEITFDEPVTATEPTEQGTEASETSQVEDGDFLKLKYNDMLVYAKTKHGLTYKQNPNKNQLIADIEKARAEASAQA